MPLFIDIHEIPGVTSALAAAEHIKDIDAQGPFAVNYSKYWLNEETGKIFCLCEAPDAEAAAAVHRLAHGVGAERIIEVTPELSELFLGPAMTDAAGAVVVPSASGPHNDTGTRTVLFTDIVGSTELTQTLGDDAGFAVVERHDALVRAALSRTNGREVKHTGDGIMAVFVSAVAAVRCANEIQHALAGEEHFEIRIGLAAGEPVERNGDFFGGAVQLAARLCSHAAPRETLVSSAVADLCIGKDLTFDDLGSVPLKGFATPVAVRRAAGASQARPPSFEAP